ncbi:MAG: bifunctional nuclease family protein [Elusimicrobia bacterium]|nr:bifunctional nuclease family protein [Elusimicrobiota bacterium]
MIEVSVDRVFFDFLSASAMVILTNKEKDKVLPIWIGIFEAQAIQAALAGEDFKRPLTHDLLKNVIRASGGKVSHVLISDLREGTFFSRIYIASRVLTTDIDARPSDAICLAVKFGSKIYVAEKIYKLFEDRVDFEKKLRSDFYNLFLKNVSKEDLKKA